MRVACGNHALVFVSTEKAGCVRGQRTVCRRSHIELLANESRSSMVSARGRTNATFTPSRMFLPIGDVNLIVDLGANVGAFSFLVRTLASQARIVAVEPDKKNVAFLRAQPFARTIEIREAAVGPFDGKARLIAGENSVTHHVDLSGSAEGEVVSLISLDSLCQEPALVKMDIEGGELSILENGLPENIRHLMLEWHYGGVPSDLVAGNWKHISTDLHGATMWYWRR